MTRLDVMLRRILVIDASFSPTLTLQRRGDIRYWSDEALAAQAGVRVAFTERVGGVSQPPFSSLNLAAHVGDDPHAVDENRRRTLSALGMPALRSRLTMCEQVHGDGVVVVDERAAGAGAFASTGPAPIAQCDALVTASPDLPLLMCFADCVPIVLVAPGPAVCIVHAGWRGALVSLPGRAVRALAGAASCDPATLIAYVGPHIGACCYETHAITLSQFVNTFGTVARAESGGLDLGAVVQMSLTDAGVSTCRMTFLGGCTSEETERFFSYRAEGGRTGRHGALACIL